MRDGNSWMARSLWFDRCMNLLDAGLRVAPFIIALLLLGLAAIFLIAGPDSL
jgi:hypothetical protein